MFAVGGCQCKLGPVVSLCILGVIWVEVRCVCELGLGGCELWGCL